MKRKLNISLVILVALGVCRMTEAQGTAFTYQGVLDNNGVAANGLYNIQFGAYSAVTGGSLVAGLVTNSAVAVSNGLFTTTIDFGPGVFGGQPLWLDIAVNTNGGAFVEVSPRQAITPSPYSIYSSQAGNAATAGTAMNVSAGTVSAAGLNTLGAPGTGQVLAFNGSQLVWQNPVIGGSSGGWSVSGNLGTVAGVNFLGTLDTQPLELKVDGMRSFRLEPDLTGNGAPNVIGGSVANYVSNSVVGATIGGGGGTTSSLSNSVTASWGTVGGGVRNVAGGQQSYVGGGFQNHASGYISTIAGGAYNTASTAEASVLGGAFNVASGIGSTVSGGGYDGNSGPGNQATASVSYVGGGIGNVASGYGAGVGSGYYNAASGPEAFIGGGTLNTANGSDGVTYFNGQLFLVLSGDSTVSGGNGNTASATGATVPGGAFNTASGDFSFAAGYHANAAHPGSFVWADDATSSPFSTTANNQFLVRAGGGVGINTAAPAATLDVAGSVHMSGPLTVGDNFTAVIGCADLQIGYSSRRGTPGRALTDFGTSLGINCCGDWPATYVGGGNVSVCSLTIRGGCDLAEPFPTTGPAIESGSVVVIDRSHPGQLKLSDTPYDTHVAGVVSGANGVNPGIALHQEGVLEGGQNVALTGRVYVLADASNGAIEPGDLLTTSTTPGHAMKVTDHLRAQGAILGKAMSTLDQGSGMVLVLVTLQ